MLDFAKVTLPLIRAGADNHAICPWCDGKGFDDEYCENGLVKLKRCSSCRKMKLPEQFYGDTRKQSRCIECYKISYGSAYRRALKEKNI